VLRRGSTVLAGPAALTVLLAGATGCTSATDAETTAQESAMTGPVVTATVTATVTAAAAPDPAAPDPAAPDPAAPDPAAPDPAPVPTPPMTVAAVSTPSATTVACDAVEEEMADAVVRYEVQALSEDGVSGGDRTAAWTDMDQALDRATQEAGAVPGLADAAAPALAEIAALRDGLSVRITLVAADADPWRDARDLLETWCDGQA